MRNTQSNLTSSTKSADYSTKRSMPCHLNPKRFSTTEAAAIEHIWNLSQKIKEEQIHFNRLEGLLSAKPFQNHVGNQLISLKAERSRWQQQRRDATKAKHAAEK